jgi:hypothetical protein
MHFGVQDAVCALARMELGASDDSKDDERQREAIYFLEQLHEHLKAITTPVRRAKDYLNQKQWRLLKGIQMFQEHLRNLSSQQL